MGKVLPFVSKSQQKRIKVMKGEPLVTKKEEAAREVAKAILEEFTPLELEAIREELESDDEFYEDDDD